MIPEITNILPIATDILVWATAIHMAVDWLFQTDWMARNKTSLRHPAAYVHSGLHALGLLIVFPWFIAVGVGISHLLIDTRKPVTWWMETVKQMPRSALTYTHVEIWLDQIFHMAVLVIAVLLLPFLTS